MAFVHAAICIRNKLAIATVLLPLTVAAKADPVFETIASFANSAKGQQPEANVIVDPSDGVSLFGTTNSGGSTDAGTIFRLTPPATPGAPWGRRLLVDFPGTEGGGYPLQLLPDGNGGLFGYTLDGGSGHRGTVFRAAPIRSSDGRWNATQLYSFVGDTDGAFPSGLIQRGRQLIGVTDQGGAGSCRDPFGDLTRCGTVYQLTPPANADGPWTEKVIYAFKGSADGAIPSGHLLLRGKTIIGTTARGGNGSCSRNGGVVGCGIVYQLSPPTSPGGNWTKDVVFSFPGGSEGAVPVDGVISNGVAGFFGVTASGGNRDASGFETGTIYELTRTDAGWQHRVIYAFAGGKDGYEPNAGLLYDAKTKTLYGTTYLGGTFGGGTVFQLTRKAGNLWSKTILHSFTGHLDGANPSSVLVSDSSGALYGVTVFGNRGGSVYRISVTP